MSKIVTAICERQVFDNVNGRLYYLGDEGEINLDSDEALSFKLSPEDRKYAIAATKARIRAREDEKLKAKDREFASIYEMRKYDAEFGDEAADSSEADETRTEPAEKPKTVVRGAKKGDTALEQMGL